MKELEDLMIKTLKLGGPTTFYYLSKIWIDTYRKSPDEFLDTLERLTKEGKIFVDKTAKGHAYKYSLDHQRRPEQEALFKKALRHFHGGIFTKGRVLSTYPELDEAYFDIMADRWVDMGLLEKKRMKGGMTCYKEGV